MSSLVEEKTADVVYVLPSLFTVVNTEAMGVRVEAVVRGTAEESRPGVPFMFRLDNLILIVHSERKRRNVYLEDGAVSVLTAPGKAAGPVLEPGKAEIVFVFPLPAIVWCPDKFGPASVCNWISCDGAVGAFWIVSTAGPDGVGRFVATPLDTSRTRPSSKVVTGVPLPLTKGDVSRSLRSEGRFFKFERWSAEISGVASASEAADADATDKGVFCGPCDSAWTDTGCIVRLSATSLRGEGETARGARKRRKRCRGEAELHGRILIIKLWPGVAG